MKIAFIGQKGIPAKLGGVERHVEELAAKLAERGHEVFVYARNNYTDKKLKEYKGVKLIHLPSISTKHLDAISHTFLATAHALFRDYDIVHYHAIGPASLSFLIKIFKRNTGLVATYHCQDYYHQKWGAVARAYLKFGEYVTCKAPDVTIAVSNTLKNFIKKKFAREAVAISSGTAVSWSPNDSELARWDLEKENYILSVSRLIRHKGIQYLIKAYRNLEQKNLTNGKKLVVVGDGFHTDDYVAELKKLSAGSPNIIFTGAQTGEMLSQLFSHAYLFVQPSEAEGLSVALIEAMGYGRATLSSDIVENIETTFGMGFSFRNKDAADLEKKLEKLLIDPRAVKEVGEQGLRKAKEHYGWNEIAEKTESVYNQVISKKHNKQKLWVNFSNPKHFG